MGYTVELENHYLLCSSQVAAERAATIIRADDWIHPYHLVVLPICRSNPVDDANWVLEVDHFQGDHWCNEDAHAVWLAIAPYMADDATIEFQGEDFDRWRIRWEGGRTFEEYVKEVIWAVSQELTPPLQEKTL